jgi:hypothetical protein
MHRRSPGLTALLLLPGPALLAQGESTSPAALTTAGQAAWQVETIAGVESFPAEDLAALAVAPRTAAAPGKWRRGSRELPLEDVIFLRAPGDGSRGGAPRAATPLDAVLLLREGGEVRARVVAPAGEAPGEESIAIRCQPLGEKPVKVALDSVLAWIAAAPAAAGGDAALLETIEAARESRSEKDVAWLAGEGRIEGVLEAFEEDGVRFSSAAAGQDVRIPYAKLRAVILAVLDEAPGGARAPANDIRASFDDGTVLPLGLLGIAQGSLRADHPSLGRIEVPVTSIREVAFLSGRVSYLSDRQPRRVREVIGAAFRPAAELRLGHKRDRNVLGGPIRLGDREHPKGLGVHSYSLLEYDLAGGFSRFQAVIGLDQCARPPAGATGTEARVVFRVILDGKPVLEKPMSWQDRPAAIDVQLGAASTLGLEVDYGEADDARSFLNAALDRADWADARLVK